MEIDKQPANKEIHKEVIEKELPKIIYEKKTMKSMTDREDIYIQVSDTTSEKALKTFNELKKNIR